VEPPELVKFSPWDGAKLVCAASGVPSPRIRWIGADTGLPLLDVGNLRKSYDNGTLILSPFAPEAYHPDVHVGQYQCQAANSFGTVLSRIATVEAGTKK
jgi:hypothetical protein